MKHLSIMVKPASSLCNLRCQYCFYANISSLRDVQSFGVMKESTTLGLLENVEKSLNPGDHVVFAFQGGEPTMAGLAYFRHFTSVTARWHQDIHVEYALQTNAMLLDEEWCGFLKEHQFLVGVSYDILPDCHDAMRVDIHGKGTYKRVEQSIALLERYHIPYNILCTLTNQVARHPQQVWKHIQRKDLRYVQFTPCLDELDCQSKSVYALTPKRFFSFYSQLFPLWYQEYRAGKYRSIKFFDDVINYLAFGIPGACGMGGRCQPQLVVEADGSAYPCDFYCLDQFRLGNVLEQSIENLVMSSPIRDAWNQRHELPQLCKDCDFLRFCGGGCKRMRREICCSEKDRFCGYGSFLRENMEALQKISQMERTLWHQSKRDP